MLESFLGASPRIDPLAYVHRAAVVIGDVTLGPESSVWPNATLRGDDAPIVIGRETSIQDGAVIHAIENASRTTIGDRVTVGHGAVLHGCTIEDDCLIGMGSIVLDGAVVETGAIVGAGALVPPGKRVERGTVVVGNPMRFSRRCTPEDLAWIAHSYRAYVTRLRQYRARDAELDGPRGG